MTWPVLFAVAIAKVVSASDDDVDDDYQQIPGSYHYRRIRPMCHNTIFADPDNPDFSSCDLDNGMDSVCSLPNETYDQKCHCDIRQIGILIIPSCYWIQVPRDTDATTDPITTPTQPPTETPDGTPPPPPPPTTTQASTTSSVAPPPSEPPTSTASSTTDHNHDGHHHHDHDHDDDPTTTESTTTEHNDDEHHHHDHSHDHGHHHDDDSDSSTSNDDGSYHVHYVNGENHYHSHYHDDEGVNYGWEQVYYEQDERCPNLTAPENGAIYCTSPRTCSLRCLDGYIPDTVGVDGSGTSSLRTCYISTNSWSDAPYTRCVKFDDYCGLDSSELEQDPNAIVRFNYQDYQRRNVYMMQHFVHARCKDEQHVFSNIQRTCKAVRCRCTYRHNTYFCLKTRDNLDLGRCEPGDEYKL